MTKKKVVRNFGGLKWEIFREKSKHFSKIGRKSEIGGENASWPQGGWTPLVSRLMGWLWYPGLPPVLVSIAFPFPSISRCFSIHSSSLAIGFHSCFFFTTDVSAPIRSTLHLLTF